MIKGIRKLTEEIEHMEVKTNTDCVGLDYKAEWK